MSCWKIYRIKNSSDHKLLEVTGICDPLKFKHNCFVSFIDAGIMLNFFETNALIMEAPDISFAVEKHVDFC